MTIPSAGSRLDALVTIMRTLRSPQGCPWDREQTLESLGPFVLEETYELLDAIDRGDRAALREELGDLVFEAVFLAQIADEEGSFALADAIETVTAKLVRRHPHVFAPDGRALADEPRALTPGQVKERWEDLKARERDSSGRPEASLLGGVPRTLPALLRGYGLSSRAATVGFDWARATDVLDKIDEELAELRAAVTTHTSRSEEAEEELGDLFFALANLSRKLGIEPESALRKANDKFQRRFEAMEATARSRGVALRELSLEEMDRLWEESKDRIVGHERKDRIEGHEGYEGHEGHEGSG
jgi:MazG family protein